MSLKRGSILIVGLDDSNHAGTDKKGEIVAASFSYYLGDEQATSRNDPRKLEPWINLLTNPPNYQFIRDIRFTLLIGEKYRTRYSNLPSSAPHLIEDFLRSQEQAPCSIHINLDGCIEKTDKEKMKEEILRLSRVEDIRIKNFIKKRQGNLRKHERINSRNGTILRAQKIIYKGHYCPKIVLASHLLASRLYASSVEDILQDPRYVEIPA